MWCPECGAEYREGFTRCEPCQVDLVAERPRPKPLSGAAGGFQVFALGGAQAQAVGEALARGQEPPSPISAVSSPSRRSGMYRTR